VRFTITGRFFTDDFSVTLYAERLLGAQMHVSHQLRLFKLIRPYLEGAKQAICTKARRVASWCKAGTDLAVVTMKADYKQS
jgi:hypothetical protein